MSGLPCIAGGGGAPAFALLQAGRVEAALVEVQNALALSPNDSSMWALLGDIHFRQAKFQLSEDAYRSALRLDPHHAHSEWGLGRLAELRNRSEEARIHFSRAFQCDPNDPDIILSYANLLKGSESRTTLYQNFLRLSNAEDQQRREQVAAQLEIDRRLGQRQLNRLTTGDQNYHFQLAGFAPLGSQPRGLVLATRINGSKPLHLVLDTGAEGVYLKDSVARKLNLEQLAEARIGGLGTTGAVAGRMSLAQSLSVDNLNLENCVVRSMNMDWLQDADGVIGTDIFKDFTITLDAKRRTMELGPLPVALEDSSVATPAYRSAQLLLVEGAEGDGKRGYYVVDTGASFTLIGATSRIHAGVDDRATAVRDARGPVGELPAAQARISVSGTVLFDREALAIDLTEISRQSGFEILGVLGFPILRQTVLKIDYRDGLVTFLK